MLRRLKHVAHAIAQAQTVEEVLAILDGIVAPVGVRAYSLWQPYSLSERNRAQMWDTMVFHAAPVEAAAALKAGFLQRGPSVMARYATISPQPFTFGEALRRLRPCGDDRWIFNAYRDHGVRDGFYCGYWPYILVYAADHILCPDALTSETRMALDAAGEMAITRIKQLTGREKASTLDLSPREKAVLSHLSDGHTVGEIAEMLGLRDETVKTFLARAARKLEARSRPHAIALAVRRRLI